MPGASLRPDLVHVITYLTNHITSRHVARRSNDDPQDLIRRCLAPKPEDRPSIAEVASHPLLRVGAAGWKIATPPPKPPVRAKAADDERKTKYDAVFEEKKRSLAAEKAAAENSLRPSPPRTDPPRASSASPKAAAAAAASAAAVVPGATQGTRGTRAPLSPLSTNADANDARRRARASPGPSPLGAAGAFYTLVPIRTRRRGERRSLRTFPGASLRPPLAFNTRPRRLSTPTDAFQLQPPRPRLPSSTTSSNRRRRRRPRRLS